MSGLTVEDEAQGEGAGGRGGREETMDLDDGDVALEKVTEEAKPVVGGGKDGAKGGAQGQKQAQGQAKGAGGGKKKKGKR